MLSCYIHTMRIDKELTKRATIYFDETLHQALKVKAAEIDSSISELVNQAVRQSLIEDAEDLEIFEKRKEEPETSFEDFVKELKRNGKL